jgi:hypothetical protein
MWKIKDNNVRSNQGVFYDSEMEEEVDLVIWGLKEWLLFVHSPGQIDKKNGGVAIFGTERG